ncbi:MAG: GNAT family N-acetyltransferase [Pseudomonadales bacterium]
MKQDVTITYVELLDPGQLRPAKPARVAYQLMQVEDPTPEYNRYLYATVGADWVWQDRLGWSRARWQESLSRPGHETWVAYVRGAPAGYFELEPDDPGSVEIVYFGLQPPYIGSGLGGALLSDAVARAWQIGARRVWLHTCSLDHPAALPNYLARGFRQYDQVTIRQELPDAPLQPWPGWN